jgi:ribosomal protein L16 Arg81 hydroxylase
MELEQLIAPLGRDEFLSGHWGKSWLHLPGQAGRFSQLLSWDDLNALLQNARLAPPQIRLSKDGENLDQERYISIAPGAGNTPHIDAGRLVALLAEGATLVLQSVEDLSPRLRALSGVLRDALQCRNHVNLYASWRTKKGFDLHWDPHEVMVLQLHGRKRWQIFAPTLDHPLDIGTAPKPGGAPAWEGVLNAGDVLYLPRGWWHVANSVNEPSMHLTLGIAPLNGVNMLNWLAGRLRQNAFLRQDLPMPGDDATVQSHLARLRAIVTEALSEAAWEEFRRDASEHLPAHAPIRLPQAPYDQSAALQDDSMIRLASSFRLVFTTVADHVSFRAYGKNYSVPDYVRPALDLLSDIKATSVAQLCAAVKGEVAVASLKQGLAMLAKEGVILVEAAN